MKAKPIKAKIKLVHGDCLEIMKKIPDNSIDLILADPPYGTTACKWDSVIPLEPMWEQLKRVIKKNGAIVLFGKEPFSSFLRISNISNWKYDWIWAKDTKSNFPQASFQPLNNLEQICVFSTGYARNFPVGNKNRKNIMPYFPQMGEGVEYKIPKSSKTTEIYKINHKHGVYRHKKKDTTKRFPFNMLAFNSVRKGVHPTQKPVILMEYLIKTYTNEREIVLDFCMGSGTTGVACSNLNRHFFGIEKDEVYFQTAKRRIYGENYES